MGDHEAPDEPLSDRIKDALHIGQPEPAAAVLHEDDRYATTETPAGVVRNLTAEEYAASYADGEPHQLPDDVRDELAAEAARIAAEREG